MPAGKGRKSAAPKAAAKTGSQTRAAKPTSKRRAAPVGRSRPTTPETVPSKPPLATFGSSGGYDRAPVGPITRIVGEPTPAPGSLSPPRRDGNEETGEGSREDEGTAWRDE
ncbi:MAG: hypothetical protein ACPW61_09245 [Methyloligella sp. ZOD6]